jgi:ferredoxin--NADP+ reductase
MPYAIKKAEKLAPDIYRLVIEAPRIAKKQRAGQFVIVRVHDRGERIPLTIAGSDPAAGTIEIIVQGIGKTTKLLCSLREGDAILDVAGPLGKPSEVERFGTVVVVGGGVGAAIAYPTAAAMKAAGNRVISILGARTRELLILEAEMRAISDELHVLTDDGSYGEKGFVTTCLANLLAAGVKPALVLAIGPVPMMRAVAQTTAPSKVRTVVSLNSIMVDGTGMCGGCRVVVGGESRFACVDGPEFDAHEVDFAVLTQRNAAYQEAERAAAALFAKEPERDLGRVTHACHLEAMAAEVRS